LSIIEAGGANTRFILDDANTFFKSVTNLLVDKFCRHVRERIIGAAIKSGQLRECKDPMWPLRVSWQGPGEATVDAGKTAQSDIALVDKGLLSHGRYWERQGKDGEHEWKRRIDEVIAQKKYIKEQAASAQIELDFKEVFNAGAPEPKPGASPSKDPTINKVGK
jgi:capsid protein